MTSTEVDAMDAGSVRAAYKVLMNDYQHLAASYESLVRQQAPAESTTSDKYRAELYDEVWERARSMGYSNVTDALAQLERQQAPAEDVAGLLNRIIPRIDAGGPNPIDQDIHCCEWTLHRERERIHAEFADALAAHRRKETNHE